MTVKNTNVWNKSSECLPVFGEYVLTLSETGTRQVGARFKTDEVSFMDTKPNTEWFWGIQNMWGKPEQITHWCYMIEKPNL